MKKTMLVSSLVLFSTVLGATSVNAGVKDDSAKSQGIIKLVVDNGSNTIIDPEDPEQEVTPGNPEDPEKPVGPGNEWKPWEPGQPEGGITGNKGPLSIDFVSPFNFGEQAIKATTETYYAQPQWVNYKDPKTEEQKYDKVPNYVQVTDKRGETTGWELTVKQLDQFTSDVEGTKPLEGAKLTLVQKGLTSVMANDNAPQFDTNEAVELTPGGDAVKLIKQVPNTGMGKWAIYFGKKADEQKPGTRDIAKPGTREDEAIDLGAKQLDGSKGVSLEIPASAVKLKNVDYKTNLEWSLKDTVENGGTEGGEGNEGGTEGGEGNEGGTFDLK